MRPAAAEPEELRVLIAAPTGRDAALLRQLLDQVGIRSEVCPNLLALLQEMRLGAGAVLLSEEALDDSLPEFEETLKSEAPWSRLPFLLFPSGSARAEVISPRARRLTSAAAVTLLDRPIRKVSLVSAVEAALRTRRQQYEVRDLLARLERGVKSRDEFLAMLSHELRNPLATILMAAQLAERRKAPDGQWSEMILRQTRLLSRLVDDLLDVARVTAGKIVLQRSPVDVGELVERCVQSLSAAATSQRVELQLQNGPRRWLLEGDSVRLEQIVNNLLTNALKYTPPGGLVEITVAAGDSQGEIRIRDTGVGIEPENLPRIFELFAQADTTLARAQGGLGIGLTLVRALVDLHGGTVRAESEGPGRGSTFIVWLPRLREAPAGVAPANELVSVSAMRILVVEDHEELREGLRALLEEMGHTVVAARDGNEGIEAAIRDRPQVALVDIGLPVLDGYAFARRVRETLGRRPLLIALTGYGLEDDRRRALEAGFDDYLAKPATVGAIQRALARAS
jgi:signal transduction histidine kinase/CheY-like chemotaxis protein